MKKYVFDRTSIWSTNDVQLSTSSNDICICKANVSLEMKRQNKILESSNMVAKSPFHMVYENGAVLTTVTHRLIIDGLLRG